MKATLVRGVNTSPYSVKNVDRNSMMNVSVTREPEKEFDIDAALELLRNKIRQIKRFFPNVDTTNLEESLDLTEKDLRQRNAYVREGKPTISASVRNAKEFVRAFTVEDLRLGLMNTRKRFPGMSVENCLKTLEREQPALVRAAKQLENESSWDLEAGWDMETGQKALQEQTDEAARDAEIRIKIAAMRKVDPSLSFERAWDILRQKEPELFGY